VDLSAPAPASRPALGILARAQDRVAAPRPDGLPVITLAWAQSVNGAITKQRGEPTPLSGPESLELTHRLRSMHAAILVGVGTVLADDPLLSVRLVSGPQPIPVLLDTHLRTPLQARILARTDRHPWIFYAEASRDSIRSLEGAGARLFQVHASDAGLDLAEVLRVMWAEGARSVMVEGGAKVLRAFFASGFPAAAAVTIAPFSMEGLTLAEESGGGTGSGPVLRHTVSEIHGRDVVLWGELGP